MNAYLLNWIIQWRIQGGGGGLLVQSSLDCRANVEQFNHQCFERSVKICEPLDIEVEKT
jgi:hypothetical protein